MDAQVFLDRMGFWIPEMKGLDSRSQWTEKTFWSDVTVICTTKHASSTVCGNSKGWTTRPSCTRNPFLFIAIQRSTPTQVSLMEIPRDIDPSRIETLTDDSIARSIGFSEIPSVGETKRFSEDVESEVTVQMGNRNRKPFISDCSSTTHSSLRATSDATGTITEAFSSNNMRSRRKATVLKCSNKERIPMATLRRRRHRDRRN